MNGRRDPQDRAPEACRQAESGPTATRPAHREGWRAEGADIRSRTGGSQQARYARGAETGHAQGASDDPRERRDATRGYQGGSGFEGTGMYGMPGSRDREPPAAIGTRSFVEEGFYCAGMDGRGHHPERPDANDDGPRDHRDGAREASRPPGARGGTGMPEAWGASRGAYGQYRALGRDDASAGHADRAGEPGWRSPPRAEPAWRQPGAAPRARGPKGWQRSDERVRDDVCERLYLDEHIDSSEVSVQVRQGVVVLDGTVPERAMKHAIEDLVDAIPGVQDIDNRIRVSLPGGARPA